MRALDPDQVQQLRGLYIRDRLESIRAKAYVFTGFGSPDAMRPDETFEVDAKGGKYTYRIGGKVRFEGPARTLASFDPESSLWTWASGSVSDPELKPFLSGSIHFPLRDAAGSFAESISETDFASFVARRLGFTGAYLQLTEAGYDLLAVTIREPAKPDALPRWCTVCGDFGKATNPLFAAGDTIAICKTSASEAIEMIEASAELASEEGEKATPTPMLCAFCGEVTAPVLGMPYYFMCHACLSHLRGAIGG